MDDARWPARCTLMGCPNPGLRPHHHHMVYGHITTVVCQCPQRDQPGTGPVEERKN